MRIPISGFIGSLLMLAVVAGLRADPYRIVATSAGPEHIDGFKLLGNGIYWWKTGIFPDQETAGVEGVIGIRQALDGVGYNRAATRTYEAIRSKSLTAPPGGVERVGDKLFYYFNDTPTSSYIYRRSVFPTATENPIAFSGSWFNRVGAMATWGGRLYWTTVQGQGNCSGGFRAVRQEGVAIESAAKVFEDGQVVFAKG